MQKGYLPHTGVVGAAAQGTSSGRESWLRETPETSVHGNLNYNAFQGGTAAGAMEVCLGLAWNLVASGGEHTVNKPIGHGVRTSRKWRGPAQGYLLACKWPARQLARRCACQGLNSLQTQSSGTNLQCTSSACYSAAPRLRSHSKSNVATRTTTTARFAKAMQHDLRSPNALCAT